MPRYTCDPQTELMGRTALSLIENIQHQNIAPILHKHGLDSINPDTWYKMQDVLNVLSDISEGANAMSNFVSIGIAAAELSVLPPEMEKLSLAQILTAYGQIYKLRHRGGDAGEVSSEQISDKHFKITMSVPYPDDVFYGVMYGYARRFRPQGAHVVVQYDENTKRRDDGGEYTIVHIKLS
jgi:hypothetical protein